MTATSARVINVEGVRNFHHGGGYDTSGGDHVRWRHVFRAGALHEAPPESVSLVGNQLGVRSIFDL